VTCSAREYFVISAFLTCPLLSGIYGSQQCNKFETQIMIFYGMPLLSVTTYLATWAHIFFSELELLGKEKKRA
jgi:hypothetical protein